MSPYLDKLLAALLSRRFQLFAAAIVLLLFRERLGIDNATAQQITAAVVAWIIGDSLRVTKTGEA